MIKRQRTVIILALCVLVLAAVAYFAVIRPLEASRAYVEEAPETLEGEELGTSNRFYMYKSLERKDMKSIEVTNSSGTYRFVKNDKDEFEIEDYSGIAVDEELLAYLVTTCGSTLSKSKVMDDAPDEKLEEYGLLTPKAYWIVTDKNDKQYKVYVGRRLLTGGGYYCMFAGRNSVYVLDTTVEKTILAPVEDYVIPYVVFGVTENDYYLIDNFTIMKGKDKFLSIGIVPDAEKNNKDAIVENVLTYPAPYVPDSEKIFNIYMSYAALTGQSTYKLGTDKETLRECGLDNPAYTVSYDYKGVTFRFFVSELQDDNTYYVVSNIYNPIITKVPRATLSYLEDGIMDWISPYIFQYYITSVNEVRIKTKDIDVTFSFIHGKDDKGADTLQVVTDSGLTIAGDDVANFREYYKALLSLQVQDYLPDVLPDGGTVEDLTGDDGRCDMTFTYKNADGKETEYKFYRYSTRRSAAVVNGKAEFYVLSDLVQKIANDTVRILNGETIEAYGKN